MSTVGNVVFRRAFSSIFHKKAPPKARRRFCQRFFETREIKVKRSERVNRGTEGKSKAESMLLTVPVEHIDVALTSPSLVPEIATGIPWLVAEVFVL